MGTFTNLHFFAAFEVYAPVNVISQTEQIFKTASNAEFTSIREDLAVQVQVHDTFQSRSEGKHVFMVEGSYLQVVSTNPNLFWTAEIAIVEFPVSLNVDHLTPEQHVLAFLVFSWQKLVNFELTMFPALMENFIEVLDLRSEAIPLKREHQVVGESNISELVSQMQETYRSIPLLVVTCPHERPRHFINSVRKLFHEFTGSCVLRFIPAPYLETLNEMLPPHLHIPKGGGRLFLSGKNDSFESTVIDLLSILRGEKLKTWQNVENAYKLQDSSWEILITEHTKVYRTFVVFGGLEQKADQKEKWQSQGAIVVEGTGENAFLGEFGSKTSGDEFIISKEQKMLVRAVESQDDMKASEKLERTSLQPKIVVKDDSQVESFEYLGGLQFSYLDLRIARSLRNASGKSLGFGR